MENHCRSFLALSVVVLSAAAIQNKQERKQIKLLSGAWEKKKKSFSPEFPLELPACNREKNLVIPLLLCARALSGCYFSWPSTVRGKANGCLLLPVPLPLQGAQGATGLWWKLPRELGTVWKNRSLQLLNHSHPHTTTPTGSKYCMRLSYSDHKGDIILALLYEQKLLAISLSYLWLFITTLIYYCSARSTRSHSSVTNRSLVSPLPVPSIWVSQAGLCVLISF